jgi:hypothetical protein
MAVAAAASSSSSSSTERLQGCRASGWRSGALAQWRRPHLAVAVAVKRQRPVGQLMVSK